MSEHDFDFLRSRVEATAERLAAVQTDRRRRNRSLLDTLSRLEEKFAAQEQELAWYRDRVAPLEAATAQLCALTARLLDMVDAGFERLDDPEDGVQQAIAVVASMLEREAAPPVFPVVPAADDAAGGIASAIDTAAGDADVDEVAAEILSAGAAYASASDGGFEDVAAEILAAEAAADEDVAGMPETVRAACNAAIVDLRDGEPAAQPMLPPAAVDHDGDAAAAMDATGDEIGSAAAAGESVRPSADDIRALLERVEAAAAQVNAARVASSEPREPSVRPRPSSGVAA
jgi:hypothetical protein